MKIKLNIKEGTITVFIKNCTTLKRLKRNNMFGSFYTNHSTVWQATIKKTFTLNENSSLKSAIRIVSIPLIVSDY